MDQGKEKKFPPFFGFCCLMKKRQKKSFKVFINSECYGNKTKDMTKKLNQHIIDMINLNKHLELFNGM